MAQPTTTAETFSGAADGKKEPEYSTFEKWQIGQQAKTVATSTERAGKPFRVFGH